MLGKVEGLLRFVVSLCVIAEADPGFCKPGVSGSEIGISGDGSLKKFAGGEEIKVSKSVHAEIERLGRVGGRNGSLNLVGFAWADAGDFECGAQRGSGA